MNFFFLPILRAPTAEDLIIVWHIYIYFTHIVCPNAIIITTINNKNGHTLFKIFITIYMYTHGASNNLRYKI